MNKGNRHIIEESAVAYDLAPTRFYHISNIIGAKDNAVYNEQDMIVRTRFGLPRESLNAIASGLGISLEALSELLHVSYRTIMRKKKGDTLSVHVSEQVFTIAEVIRRGVEVLGSQEDFRIWLKTHLPSLDHHTPLEYLDTSFGADIVLRILGRIEHGVY